MFSVPSCVRAAATAVGGNNGGCGSVLRVRRYAVSLSSAQRSYMSTQPLPSPEEEPHMLLVLGKPGGGKGTICGKLLKVSGPEQQNALACAFVACAT